MQNYRLDYFYIDFPLGVFHYLSSLLLLLNPEYNIKFLFAFVFVFDEVGECGVTMSGLPFTYYYYQV